MAETIVTWAGAKKGDGEREATNLYNRNPRHCRLMAINKIFGKVCFPLIIVGHDNDIYNLIPTYAEYIRNCTSWVVLAGCSTGVGVYTRPLEYSRRPAGQILANMLDIKVSATNRVLLFREVGESLVFARSGIIDMLIPTNYPSFSPPGDVWVEFRKQSKIDDLTEALSYL